MSEPGVIDLPLPELKAKPGCCEEASPLSHNFYIPCNRPAETILWSKADNREYRMCKACADHNTRRGMVIRRAYVRGADADPQVETIEALPLVDASASLIGHNEAPDTSPLQDRLAETYAPLAAEVEALADKADAMPPVINSDAEQGAVSDFVKELTRARKKVEARRVDEKEPYLRGEREVDGYFVPYRQWIDQLMEDMNARSKEYLDRKADEERRRREEEERRRREEERRAREEAARKMREAAEAERKAAEAARLAREEEDRREREAARLRREEEDRVARAALAARREEEERQQRAAENASRQKMAALEKAARERREREEREAAEAEKIRLEAERQAAEARAKADAERAAAAAESERKMAEAKKALEDADRAEAERLDAQRRAEAAPAEMARTRGGSSLATLARSYDFEVTDWSAVDLAVLRPYIPRQDIEKYIRAFVKVNKGAVLLAGVRIYPTTKVQNR